MDIDIEDNGDGTFSIYYTAKDAGEYTINIKFGGQPIPDGVYSFTVSVPQRTKISHPKNRLGGVKFLRFLRRRTKMRAKK